MPGTEMKVIVEVSVDFDYLECPGNYSVRGFERCLRTSLTGLRLGHDDRHRQIAFGRIQNFTG